MFVEERRHVVHNILRYMMAIDSMAVSDSKEMVLLVAKFSFDEIAILIGFVGIVGVESLPCSI